MATRNTVFDPSAGKKALFSTLWIFLMFNYLYCDFLSNMESTVLKGLLDGQIAGMAVTPAFMLNAALLMEIPTAMVLLSRVLPFRVNRWANIVAGLIMTLVQVGSLFVGSGPTPHYIFYSVIEASTAAFIVWFAWNWRAAEAAE
ncbi:hypothetical protein hrd7_14510 [Leptolinea sp. HRD-7]|nr:hypothetical protein hrd7_14510 [Leptolinea sp. HRD-7]